VNRRGHKKRLVRFTAVYLPRAAEHEDGFVLDAFVDEKDNLCGTTETFGYRLTHVGIERRERYDLVRIKPDHTIVEYADVCYPDKHENRVRQTQNSWRINKDVLIKVGSEFIDKSEDEYPCEIVDVMELVNCDARRLEPKPAIKKIGRRLT
jgi:hypothetical protein